MTIITLGTLSVGAAVPGANAAVTAGIGGINGALPDLLARLAALQAFVPQPVTFAAQLDMAQSILGSVQSAIALGLPVPDISAQLAAIAALIAALEAMLATINGQLSVLVNLQPHLAVGGVAAYAYEGQLGSFGSELDTAIGSSTTPAHGLALVATDPDAWAALSAVMKVTP